MFSVLLMCTRQDESLGTQNQALRDRSIRPLQPTATPGGDLASLRKGTVYSLSWKTPPWGASWSTQSSQPYSSLLGLLTLFSFALIPLSLPLSPSLPLSLPLSLSHTHTHFILKNKFFLTKQTTNEISVNASEYFYMQMYDY